MRRATLTPEERRYRWLWLTLVTAPVFGAALYNQGWQIPGLRCWFYHVTGIPCPGCGLTRSFMAMARGDVVRAVQFHAFGPLLYGALVLLGIHLMAELVSNRSLPWPYRRWWGQQRWQWGLLGLFLGYYLVRLAVWYQRGELPGRVVW